MKFTFRASSEDDLAAIAAFLNRVFNAPPGAVFSDPAQLHWKYWAPRKDWQGARSFVLEKEGKIVSHGCVWPQTIHAETQTAQGVNLIDWAADPGTPGAGASLLRKIGKRFDVVYVVGGTDEARRVLSAFGFAPATEIQTFARPIRPWSQIRSHQFRNWKLPLRLLRNSLWRYPRPEAAPNGWSVVALSAEELPLIALPQASNGVAVFARTPELFRYLRTCPTTSFELWGVRRKGDWVGYFCVALVPGVLRIVDAGLAEPSLENWVALYGLAQRQALQYPGVCEVVTAVCTTEAQAALLRSGFRLRKRQTLLIHQRQKHLDPGLRFALQMIDSDAAFLHQGRPEYFT